MLAIRAPLAAVLTRELIQEAESFAQLKQCWSGWVPARPEPDIGIDLVFDVVDEDGVPAGVSFNVQVKSTPRLEDHVSKKGRLTYRIEVDHLRKWEPYRPMILVVWDTTAKKGCWQDITETIAALNREQPDWRSKKKLSVTLDLDNSCDGEGRKKLRRHVGEIGIDSLIEAYGFEIDAAFTFPHSDPEAVAKAAEFQAARADGTPVEIPGKFVEVTFPEWYVRRTGLELDRELTVVRICASKPPPTVFPIALQAVGETGVVEIPLLLRMIRRGEVRTIYSNEHDSDRALTFELTFDDNKRAGDARVSVHLKKCTRRGLAQLLPYILAVREGATTMMVADGRPDMPVKLDNILDQLPSTPVLLLWKEALAKLAFVESKLTAYGPFDFSQFDERSFAVIFDLFNMLSSASPRLTRTIHSGLTLTLTKPFRDNPLSKRSRSAVIEARELVEPLRITHPPSRPVILLGARIPVRQVVLTCHDYERVERAFEFAVGDGALKIEVEPTDWEFSFNGESLGPPPKRRRKSPTRRKVRSRS